MTLVMVVAGGLGALARYALAGWVQRRAATDDPWGTAIVNIVGAAALALLVAAASRGRVDDATLLVGGTGFLGGFTTFSTWMVESVHLTERGAWRAVVANLVVPVLVGAMLVWALVDASG